jgi:hypothetical protein
MPHPASALSLPALETLLGRGEAESFAPSDLEAALFALFGVELPPGGDLPVAAVTRVVDAGTREEGYWLRADPAHLVPNRDQLVLAAVGGLGISRDDAEHLAADINSRFGDAGWHLDAPVPDRWYLQLDDDPGIRTVPPSAAAGRDIRGLLPAGEHARHWHALINELQMVLHGSPVNAAREGRGEPAVNSLWLWGGGRLPRVPKGTWIKVWGNDPLAEGLARLSGTATAALPAKGDTWLASALDPGGHLAVLSGGLDAIRRGDLGRWLEFVQVLETDWFVPLLGALRSGELQTLSLLPLAGWNYSLGRRELRRWWRRRPPFVHACSQA